MNGDDTVLIVPYDVPWWAIMAVGLVIIVILVMILRHFKKLPSNTKSDSPEFS